MPEAETNPRRRFLVAATSVIGAVGVIGGAIPFVSALRPNASARATAAPVRVDVSRLQPGQRLVVEWQGRPIWVLKRSAAMRERTLEVDSTRLADPDSRRPQQPAYVQGVLRSLRPEIGVFVGLCTHLGCAPLLHPDPQDEVSGFEDWPGGFFCPCHGSRFDLAGRVFRRMPAPLNLEVPPHHFASATVLVIGEDQPPQRDA